MAAKAALLKLGLALIGAFGWIGTAAAQAPGSDSYGGPRDWEIWHQPAASPIMERLEAFHFGLVVLITLISLFVLGLLVYVIVRFNAKVHPTPSRTTHNTAIEILWTVVPVLILVGVAIPSFRLLYAEDRIPEAGLTVKATGYQWYWNYTYPDHEGVAFDSMMIEDKDLKPGQPRLLTADKALVVPVGTVVRVLVTAADVIHAFAVPAFGVKIDAVPGRLHETWFRADRTGTFYGQCSELCGTRHALMPIQVEVMSKPDFEAWLGRQKSASAGTQDTTRVAQAKTAD